MDKGYDMFLLFLFYYARQAHNFKNQMFLTSKYKSASMVYEKTLLQRKFCCKLKVRISKVSKRGVHPVVRLQKKRGGTAIIRTAKSAAA